MPDFTIKAGSVRYSRQDNSAIDCIVTIDSIGQVPFTATANDPSARGQEIWQTLQSMTIKPYQAAPSPVLTRISKYDLIARLTDDELDNLQAELNLASSRLNLIWGAIMYIDTADSNYSTLRDVFVSQLGEARANEVLTPKE